MKKILVPTDFSGVSGDAAHFAADLALASGASVDLLHVMQMEAGSGKLMNWQKLERELIKSADESAAKLVASLKQPVRVDYHHATGYPIRDVVEEFAKKHHNDIVVIGTHGASGLKKAFLGSNAASVIDGSSVPVITVPQGCAFKGIKKILYATDMNHLDEEVKIVSKFARNFDATIDIVHISNKEAVEKKDHKELEAILVRMANYDKITLSVEKHESLAEGIDKAISRIKPDLLVMFTHELGLYEKMTGKGVSREMAFRTSVPLLTFNRSRKPAGK